MSNAGKSFNLAKLVTPRGMKIEVFQSSTKAELQVYFEGTKAQVFDLPVTIADNTLADIIVRGIRDLERERIIVAENGRMSGAPDIHQERDLDALGRTAVGHGAG